MQDSYIGDIGDYGKYGLLREVCAAAMSLSVNWYKVVPTKAGKQDDGKYISYLSMPQIYREYDPVMFDALYKIVLHEQDRRIERVELISCDLLFRAVRGKQKGMAQSSSGANPKCKSSFPRSRQRIGNCQDVSNRRRYGEAR